MPSTRHTCKILMKHFLDRLSKFPKISNQWLCILGHVHVYRSHFVVFYKMGGGGWWAVLHTIPAARVSFLIPVRPSLVYRLVIRRPGKGEGWGEEVQGFLFFYSSNTFYFAIEPLRFNSLAGQERGAPLLFGSGQSGRHRNVFGKVKFWFWFCCVSKLSFRSHQNRSPGFCLALPRILVSTGVFLPWVVFLCCLE